MTPFVRKLALLAHIVTSIGWIGAVAVYIALAEVALLFESHALSGCGVCGCDF